MQKTDTQMLLYRARLLLEEGRYEAALIVLETIHTEDEKQFRDVSYLLGWGYIQCKRWHDARRVLAPILEQSTEQAEQETPLERERLALYLLQLGLAAVKLAHYEDASLHFTVCLKVLHDRRVHLPAVRIKARYSLAMTCLMRGLFTTAIGHYEEALRLCQHYHDERELPHIYHGLCDAYPHVGDFVKAYLAGEKALHLYEEAGDRQMEARIHSMLGRICMRLSDYREASDHYTESLAIANSHNGPTMAMLNCAWLAELRMTEGRVEEARRYCQRALEAMERTTDQHMQGRVYHSIGKVTHEQARQAEGSARHLLLEETATWYERAVEKLNVTQASADMAEVYGGWGQVLEELGRAADAIVCWRRGYEVMSSALQ